jgi:hypothetical protein
MLSGQHDIGPDRSIGPRHMLADARTNARNNRRASVETKAVENVSHGATLPRPITNGIFAPRLSFGGHRRHPAD